MVAGVTRKRRAASAAFLPARERSIGWRAARRADSAAAAAAADKRGERGDPQLFGLNRDELADSVELSRDPGARIGRELEARAHLSKREALEPDGTKAERS